MDFGVKSTLKPDINNNLGPIPHNNQTYFFIFLNLNLCPV